MFRYSHSVCSSFEICPGEQGVQFGFPDNAIVFGGQQTHSVLGRLGTVPLGHGVQAVALPMVLMKPGGQTSHIPVATFKNCPGLQVSIKYKG